MALNPHSIVGIDADALMARSPLPAWAQRSLRRCPYAVVRRALAPAGWVAAGVRGRRRGQRLALLIPGADIRFCITPESLVASLDAGRIANRRARCFRALAQVHRLMRPQGLCWGPVGSVGFELATGSRTTHAGSDLDLILRTPRLPPRPVLCRLAEELSGLAASVDVLLEADFGAVCLREYLDAPARILIRTPHGPALEPCPL